LGASGYERPLRKVQAVLEETKKYVKGMYGTPPGKISEDIYVKILGPNWRDEVIDCRPASLLEPTYERCREELEKLGLLTKEEDIISYAFFPEQMKKLLSGEAEPEFTSDQLPLEQKMLGRKFKVSLNNEEYEVTIKKVTATGKTR